jgi:hypothetical protein
VIYRATTKFKSDPFPPALTPRAPGNVPFHVDNIWEWLRPENYPSRRVSAFASPKPGQAADSAGCRLDQVYEVELLDNQPFCQIVTGTQPEDAKYHPDIGRMKQSIMRALPQEWFALPIAGRGPEAALFLPCLTRDETETLMAETRLLKPDLIRAACTFWDDIRLFEPGQVHDVTLPGGEIFFQGNYRLLGS